MKHVRITEAEASLKFQPNCFNHLHRVDKLIQIAAYRVFSCGHTPFTGVENADANQSQPAKQYLDQVSDSYYNFNSASHSLNISVSLKFPLVLLIMGLFTLGIRRT